MTTRDRLRDSRSTSLLGTESVDPRFADVEAWPLAAILDGLIDHHEAAIAAVRGAIPQLSQATAAAEPALARGGRLIYVGAGTSGRLATQDGVELTPTFSWPRARARFLMAGGEAALTRSVEGAEDDAEAGAREMAALAVGGDDVAIGVAASGTTPYVIAAVAAARRAGAVTIAIACNRDAPLLAAAAFPVLLDTGAEAIAGSTRLKAGTAQKVALNAISTTLMIRLGRVYRGQMVEMQASNIKLRRRAVAMITRLAGVEADAATAALEAADGELKTALLMRLEGLDASQARARLAAAGGLLSRARAER